MFRILVISLLLLSCSKNRLNEPKPQKNNPTTSVDWDVRTQKNVKKLLSEQKNLRFTQDEIEHLQWVAKASLLLRGQKELSLASDDINQLKKLSKEQVVDLFLNSNDFYNSVVDFSLYYMGFRVDPFLLQDQKLNSRIADFSQTISAAQALSKNEDFLKIFELYPPTYIKPLEFFDENIYSNFGLQKPALSPKSNQEKRNDFFEALEKKIDDFKKMDASQVEQNKQSICPFFSMLTVSGPIFTFPLPIQSMGFENNIYYDLLYKNEINSDTFCTTFFIDTNGTINHQIKDFATFSKGLDNAKIFIHDLKHFNSSYDISTYAINTTLDYQTYSYTLSYGRLSYENTPLSFTLTNSSTNMNRKRAAYILKHFLCDDLTPVNVKVDDDHTNGAHGSNPSCYACHYKLDPMAGFFKNHGIGFSNFFNQTDIFFDDFAKADLVTYQKQWLKPDGKTWNIGYIQSTQFDHLNQYGENLEDLHKILQTTPEVKRCLVKRIFEYSTNPNQIFDPGFIDTIATDFAKENTQSPQLAFKNIFRKAALSQTFAESNPVASECYDIKQGVDPTTRPPCQVAHILETNCVKCHSSTTGKTSLDLSRWVDTGAGKMGFAHIDEATGQQINPKITFQTMLDRLTTADEFDRMPPGDMDPVYRQILFQWLNKKIGE